ncbi:MAG: hypothetical protein AAGG02_15695, partial [Cyanobacteria bacterium P01_H01_bin.15]
MTQDLPHRDFSWLTRLSITGSCLGALLGSPMLPAIANNPSRVWLANAPEITVKELYDALNFLRTEPQSFAASLEEAAGSSPPDTLAAAVATLSTQTSLPSLTISEDLVAVAANNLITESTLPESVAVNRLAGDNGVEMVQRLALENPDGLTETLLNPQAQAVGIACAESFAPRNCVVAYALTPE